MFTITADQINSRHTDDLVGSTLLHLDRVARGRLVLPADRTAGDELQAATLDAACALDLVLHLTRDGRWSVGLGIGAVRAPLPEATRAMRGPAFEHARDAVDTAKRRSTRFAISVESGRTPTDETLQPLLDLLIALRGRRSAEGWELYDLVAGASLTQAEAAARLGITPQAASKRALASGLRLDLDARPALVALLDSAGLAPLDSAGRSGEDR